jgi:sulfur carrier protein
MNIKLNNTVHELEEGTSLLQFLERISLHQVKGTAIALNGKVIPRSNWQSQKLNHSDTLIMITASQGG